MGQRSWHQADLSYLPASDKIERYSGLLKTTLKAMGGGTVEHREKHLAEASWSVYTRGSINHSGPPQSSSRHTVEGDKVPVVPVKSMSCKTVWVLPASGKDKPLSGISFAQGPECTWWVLQKDGAVQCVPQGNLMLGDCSQ